jgi:choline-glycine betaine transporter
MVRARWAAALVLTAASLLCSHKSETQQLAAAWMALPLAGQTLAASPGDRADRST